MGLAGIRKKMDEKMEHYGRENLSSAVAFVGEFLAMKYGIAWLAWLAVIFVCLAVFGYTKKLVRQHQGFGYLIRVVAILVTLIVAIFMTIPKTMSQQAQTPPQTTPRTVPDKPPVDTTPQEPEVKPLPPVKVPKKSPPNLEMKQGTPQPPPKSLTQNCPQGNCVGGDNYGPLTVNPDVDPNKTVTRYEYNGIRHLSSPGNENADMGANDSFIALRAKFKAKDWSGAANFAEQQKQEYPGWITPYLFAGEAYAQLCQKDKAISNLEDFVRKAENVNTFEDVLSAAEKDLNSLKSGHGPKQCD